MHKIVKPDNYFSSQSSTIDYYPFGQEMPGRVYSPTSYRYGFNGKENDNEVAGTGNWQNYGFREYDARVCRFISVDPLTKDYPELTPFQFASNTPIRAIDLDGLEAFVLTSGTGRNNEGGYGHSLLVVAQYKKIGVYSDGSNKMQRTGFMVYSNPGSYIGHADIVGKGNNSIGQLFQTNEEANKFLNDNKVFDGVFSITKNSFYKVEFREKDISLEKALDKSVKEIADEDHPFGTVAGYNCTEFVSDAIIRAYGDKVSKFLGKTDVTEYMGKDFSYFNPNQLATDLKANKSFTIFNSKFNPNNLSIKNFKRVFKEELSKKINNAQ